MDHIVVLGHRGFIGGQIFRALKQRFPSVKVADLPSVDLTNPGALDEVEWTADSVLVMTSGVKKQRGDNLDLFADNVAMAEQVARAIEKRPIGRMIFFSSADVYGEDVQNKAINEETAVCPRSFYGMSKFASEGILAKTVEAGGGTILNLRPPLIYGPHEAESFYGPTSFARRGRIGETITLWGDGDELREFMFVDDIVQTVLGLVESDVSGVLNPVAGRSYRFSDILELLQTRFGQEFETQSRERSKSKVDNAFVSDRFRAACPDVIITSLEEGLRQILEEEV